MSRLYATGTNLPSCRIAACRSAAHPARIEIEPGGATRATRLRATSSSTRRHQSRRWIVETNACDFSLSLSLARARALSFSRSSEARTKGAPVEFVAPGALTRRSSLPLPLALSSHTARLPPSTRGPPSGRPSVSLDPSPLPSVALSRRYHVCPFSFFFLTPSSATSVSRRDRDDDHHHRHHRHHHHHRGVDIRHRHTHARTHTHSRPKCATIPRVNAPTGRDGVGKRGRDRTPRMDLYGDARQRDAYVADDSSIALQLRSATRGHTRRATMSGRDCPRAYRRDTHRCSRARGASSFPLKARFPYHSLSLSLFLCLELPFSAALGAIDTRRSNSRLPAPKRISRGFCPHSALESVRLARVPEKLPLLSFASSPSHFLSLTRTRYTPHRLSRTVLRSTPLAVRDNTPRNVSLHIDGPASGRRATRRSDDTPVSCTERRLAIPPEADSRRGRRRRRRRRRRRFTATPSTGSPRRHGCISSTARRVPARVLRAP